jgi:hypothetical protein
LGFTLTYTQSFSFYLLPSVFPLSHPHSISSSPLPLSLEARLKEGDESTINLENSEIVSFLIPLEIKLFWGKSF